MYKGNKMDKDFNYSEIFENRPIGNKNNMVRKRITITIHEIELNKLKQIAKENKETISGMITRLIQQHKNNTK